MYVLKKASGMGDAKHLQAAIPECKKVANGKQKILEKAEKQLAEVKKKSGKLIRLDF